MESYWEESIMNVDDLSLSGLSLNSFEAVPSKSLVVRRKLDRSLSESDSAPSNRKSLFERRKEKLQLEGLSIGEKPKIEENKAPEDRLVDELNRKLLDEGFSPLGDPLVSADGTLGMYRVYCNDGQNILIHSLRPKEIDGVTKIEEAFSGSIWELNNQENTVVCALADPGGRPIYMPPQQNANELKSLPINVGDLREFPNGICLRVQQITPLSDITDAVLKHQGKNQQDNNPIAREVKIELSKLGEGAKVVSVIQIFSCWSDGEYLAPEIALKIVEKLTAPKLQLHCEGGENRSPAAAAMLLLSKKMEGLYVENLLDEVAAVIKHVRRRCHNKAAINKEARKSILLYTLHAKGFNAEDILPLHARCSGPNTAPASSSIKRFAINIAGVSG